ncbi:MAG: Xaa-Pro peptidase family protein [Anaerolineae bacterium]|jgi:Xaa-Pro aminopeptidase|nr:Xaa-Pro peptidase family protein [Anaerolineae bacterium]
MDAERAARLRAGLHAAGAEALLAWHTEEIVLTTGKYPHWGMTLCLYPQAGTPIVYTFTLEPDFLLPQEMEIRRYGLSNTPGFNPWDNLRRQIEQDARRLNVRRVVYTADSGKHALPGNTGEDTPLSMPLIAYLLAGLDAHPGDFAARQMQQKTAHEIERIRLSNRIAHIGIRRFHELLAAGRTEAEIAGQVEAAIHAQTGRDCNLARAWAFVNAGPNARYGGTFSRSSGYELQTGDLAMLELGTVVDGYWSDLTRTTVVGGSPTAAQADLLEAGRAAQAAGIAAVKPGVAHEAIDAAARQVLTSRGYGAGFHHATGHHVGLRYHDHGPMLAAGSSQPLLPGMIVTVEPGTYADHYGGCRFEDNVLVTDTGHDILSRFDESA